MSDLISDATLTAIVVGTFIGYAYFGIGYQNAVVLFLGLVAFGVNFNNE